MKSFAVAAGMVFCVALPAWTAEFKFRHHFIDRDLPGGSWAQTALVDVDKDGRLGYLTGQTRGPIFWYRQETLDRWERHTLGDQSPSDVGGQALDVDGDGDLDIVSKLWLPRQDNANGGRNHVDFLENLLITK